MTPRTPLLPGVPPILGGGGGMHIGRSLDRSLVPSCPSPSSESLGLYPSPLTSPSIEYPFPPLFSVCVTPLLFFWPQSLDHSSWVSPSFLSEENSYVWSFFLYCVFNTSVITRTALIFCTKIVIAKTYCVILDRNIQCWIISFCCWQIIIAFVFCTLCILRGGWRDRHPPGNNTTDCAKANLENFNTVFVRNKKYFCLECSFPTLRTMKYGKTMMSEFDFTEGYHSLMINI